MPPEISSAGVWETLGYSSLPAVPGQGTVAWQAGEEYCFPTAGGPVVQGGLVTALLDAAMGVACSSVLGDGEAFLTADLRVEFHRSARPGLLVAKAEVLRRSRRLAFCAAELVGPNGEILAQARCTQALLEGPRVPRETPPGVGPWDGARGADPDEPVGPDPA